LKSKKNKSTSYNWVIKKSIADINQQHWQSIEAGLNIYLTSEYLSAIEISLQNELDFRYCLIYKNDIPVAISVIVLVPFYIKPQVESALHKHLIKLVKSHLKILKGTSIATCGSPFACGQNGFMFSEKISSAEAFNILAETFNEINQHEPFEQKPDLFLVKECWPNSLQNSNQLADFGFRDFMIDNNMVVKISDEWKNFDDYLNCMITKFRTKAKSAYKKSTALMVKDLNLDDIKNHAEKLIELYAQVVNKSEFSFGILNHQSFNLLKKNLGKAFIVKGYFLENELVGFSTAFVFNKIMDANYVGIDYSKNQAYSIYPRMLYDFVDEAIQAGCSELRLGRTAEEIKSTIGAMPVNMTLYLNHSNILKNALLKPILCQIKPTEYPHRFPFKKTFESK
jgi:predicted N-acyltransferase